MKFNTFKNSYEPNTGIINLNAGQMKFEPRTTERCINLMNTEYYGALNNLH